MSNEMSDREVRILAEMRGFVVTKKEANEQQRNRDNAGDGNSGWNKRCVALGCQNPDHRNPPKRYGNVGARDGGTGVPEAGIRGQDNPVGQRPRTVLGTAQGNGADLESDAIADAINKCFEQVSTISGPLPDFVVFDGYLHELVDGEYMRVLGQKEYDDALLIANIREINRF